MNPPQKIFNLPYTKIWIGDKSKFQYPDNWLPKFVGNSILIQQSKTEQVWIGQAIKKFSLKDDSIEEYFSDMGNNGVPQPFAIGKKNVYFFIDMTPSGISAVPKSALDLSNDLQEQLWDRYERKAGYKMDPIKKAVQVKVLHSGLQELKSLP